MDDIKIKYTHNSGLYCCKIKNNKWEIYTPKNFKIATVDDRQNAIAIVDELNSLLNDKFFEILQYQEAGFASKENIVARYKNKEKANNKCKKLKKEDPYSFYSVLERKFND